MLNAKDYTCNSEFTTPELRTTSFPVARQQSHQLSFSLSWLKGQVADSTPSLI